VSLSGDASEEEGQRGHGGGGSEAGRVEPDATGTGPGDRQEPVEDVARAAAQSDREDGERVGDGNIGSQFSSWTRWLATDDHQEREGSPPSSHPARSTHQQATPQRASIEWGGQALQWSAEQSPATHAAVSEGQKKGVGSVPVIKRSVSHTAILGTKADESENLGRQSALLGSDKVGFEQVRSCSSY
jgi:hypothetical protein